ncbi:ROK family protein [Niabella pedocola]|uniref:ROK family protein n=1 Tax=Niabella pedocola TaxID=1752077 RepID=A0ABS8PWM5_9BACT|nr:ROK family protein [Niabella pedocola]MCD2424733.1 ROK family protein [Niabella pedocola]
MASITLAIDIGGSKVKGCTLNAQGEIVQEYIKLPTPVPATPENLVHTIKELVKDFRYDQVSAGFPGYVRNNIVYTAPNLGSQYWNKIDLAALLSKTLGKPARVVNDADMLGLGCIEGKGFEMMITLGTGFGTAFFLDGKLLPHLEIGQHPCINNKTYDQYLGQRAYDDLGKKEWNKRLQAVLKILQTTFNYDHLFIGGGLAKKITLDLKENMTIVSNVDGIDGGVQLWKQ